MTNPLFIIVVLVFAYALGALPLSYMLARRWAGVDLHEAGSGSVGATNVMRTAGWPLGLLVLVFDITKGALAVWIAAHLLSFVTGLAPDIVNSRGPVPVPILHTGIGVGFQTGIQASLSGTTFAAMVALAGVAVIVGHVYPVTLGFRGGKGVATASGVFAMLAPHAALLSVVAFAIVAWTTRYVSLGSIAGAVVLPLACAASAEMPETLLASCGAAIIIVLRHRENLNRLHAGTEPRFGRQFTERG
jgi:acyl phosphate:glycerol-3-phosphate acyltransferase